MNHTVSVEGSIDGDWFWTCSCGQGLDGIGSEKAARASADAHQREK